MYSSVQSTIAIFMSTHMACFFCVGKKVNAWSVIVVYLRVTNEVRLAHLAVITCTESGGPAGYQSECIPSAVAYISLLWPSKSISGHFVLFPFRSYPYPLNDYHFQLLPSLILPSSKNGQYLMDASPQNEQNGRAFIFYSTTIISIAYLWEHRLEPLSQLSCRQILTWSLQRMSKAGYDLASICGNYGPWLPGFHR